MSRLGSARLWLALVGAAAALVVAGVALVVGGVIGLDRGLESLVLTGFATLAGTGWFKAYQEHRRVRQAERNLAAAQQATVTSALRDRTTGLASERIFETALRKSLASAQRYGHPFSVLLVEVNGAAGGDSRGAPNDRVLKYLAGVFTRYVRDADTIARLREEMFGFLLPDTDYEGAQRLWERLREAAFADWPEHRWWAIFGGAAGYSVDVGSFESLLSDADRRLALEKRRLRAEPEA
jgi:diguanylate cyclase (GGDEF)-like protein